MKEVLLFVIAFALYANSYAQKTELRVSLDSGLSSFRGESAESTSSIYIIGNNNTGTINNPYGSKNAISYGASLNLKRITKVNFIYGVGIGYEDFRSEISLTTLYKYQDTDLIPVSGKNITNVNSITVNPFAGYRFNADQFPIDLTAGFDVANILSTKQKGDATDANGNKYTTYGDRQPINTDYRARIQVSTDYQKFGIYVGYSFGLRSYMESYDGGTNQVYSKILRFGVTYQIF